MAASVLAGEVKVDLSADWAFSKGGEFPGASGELTLGGTGSPLVLAYNFSGGGAYVSASKRIEPLKELTGVSVTATGPGGVFTVALVDATGQTLLYRLGLLEAQSKTFDLALGKPNASYGGANDKTPHFPLKAIRLLAEKSPAGTELEGKISVSNILLRTP